jgi:hypothetical protein
MSLLGLYPTKKALKDSVGQSLRYKEKSIAGPEYRPDGSVQVQGPNPDELRWAAEVTLKGGLIVKVR